MRGRPIACFTCGPCGRDSAEAGPQTFDLHQSTGFYSLVFLAQAFHKQNVTTPVQIAVVSSELHVVAEGDRICPSKSTLLGACKVLPQEYSNLQCKSIDIGDRGLDAAAVGRIVDELTSRIAGANGGASRRTVVRAGVQSDAARPPPPEPVRLRRHGVYLITGGGLGNIGLEIAQALAEQAQARLVLTGRSEFPRAHRGSSGSPRPRTIPSIGRFAGLCRSRRSGPRCLSSRRIRRTEGR